MHFSRSPVQTLIGVALVAVFALVVFWRWESVSIMLGLPMEVRINHSESFIVTSDSDDPIDLGGILRHKKLAILHVQGKVKDLRPLERLPNMRMLTLQCGISDISALGRMTGLEDLYLWQNNIIDIGPLSQLTSLQSLYLSHNRISDIGPLSALPKLQTLSLRHNHVSDISSLVNNPGLGRGDDVDLRENPLNDQAYTVHIPALQKKGVTVLFDPKQSEK